jgi:hypothetical protein
MGSLLGSQAMTSLTKRIGCPRFLCKHVTCHGRLRWRTDVRLLIAPECSRCTLRDVQCLSLTEATAAGDEEQLQQTKHTLVALKPVQRVLGALAIAAAFAAFCCGQGGVTSQFASATAATGMQRTM